MKPVLSLLILLIPAGLMPAAAQSGPPAWGQPASERPLQNPFMNQFSPGQAREAVREGRTVPLSVIFSNLKQAHGGYQLGAELYSRGDGTTFYEIDWMTGDGRKAHFRVDAQSGQVIGSGDD